MKTSELLKMKEKIDIAYKNFNDSFKEDETDGICVSTVEDAMYYLNGAVEEMNEFLINN